MTVRDCAFQYATEDGVVHEDTPLITREEAEDLWRKYVPKFKEDLEREAGPEMGLWVDMKSEVDYHTAVKHWCAEDCIVRNGRLYALHPLE